MQKVQSLVEEHAQNVDDILEMRTQKLFREQPFRTSPNYVQNLAEMLEQYPFREMVNFN